MITNIGQRIDRLQRALKSQPSSSQDPHTPLKHELEDLIESARQASLPDIEELVKTALESVSSSFESRINPILKRLRELAADQESGQSFVFLYFGPSSDRLSDLRAFGSSVNALVFQTEDLEQCKDYLSQLTVQSLILDVHQKKAELQKTLSALEPERFPDVSFLICSKKPKMLLGKSEPISENVHFLGAAPAFPVIEDKLRKTLPTESTRIADPVLLNSEELISKLDYFKHHISVWSFGWLDASELDAEAQKNLEDLLLSGLRSSDIRGVWDEAKYIALLPHTDTAKAQAALEKFFVAALQPPVTPLRIAIVKGEAETKLEDLVEEAETMLQKEARPSSEPALISPINEETDRTLSCLLLDDSPLLYKSLQELTRAEGLEISQSTSVPDALDKTKDIHPYQLLIVTDTLILREGIEWIRVFREKTPNHRMPILLISDPLPDEKIRTLYDVGITHVLYRPIDAKRLAETIYLLLAAPAKSDGSFPPGVLCTSEDSKTLLSLSMVLHRETGLPLRLSKGWKDALNRLYHDPTETVLMDIQQSPDDALTLLKTARDFKVSPAKGYLIILKSEHQAYREAFHSFDKVTILNAPLDPQDIPAHIRIKLKLAPMRRFPPDDKRFQLEVSRVMQIS